MCTPMITRTARCLHILLRSGNDLFKVFFAKVLVDGLHTEPSWLALLFFVEPSFTCGILSSGGVAGFWN